MQAWQVHRWWLTRTALLSIATCLATAAVGGLAAHPFPWVVLIPATLPFSMAVFVILPMLHKATDAP